MKSSSSYVDGLEPEVKKRYLTKISLAQNIDPYELGKNEWTSDTSKFPNLAYPDIFYYLLYTTSAYTQEQIKAYKGLDAYNQFVSGWVNNVQVHALKDVVIITSKVLHSQRPKDTALRPWLIIKNDGQVLAAHCHCMAGLGESCTHIAATLFSIEAAVKLRDSKTVTQEKAYWLPASVKGIPYSTIDKIDFTSAKTKKRNLDLELIGSPIPERQHKEKTVPSAADADISSLLNELSVAGANSAILSLVSPFNDKFIPKALDVCFPKLLTDLVDENTFNLSYGELLKHIESLTISITQDECDAVEANTQNQANSKLWNRFRSGRITASRMKAACHSKPSVPSLSLIKSLCNPDSFRLKTPALEWGCQHEKVAKDTYVEAMHHLHDNFQLRDSGLVLNPDYPVFGASPDGLCYCDCCGEGVLEIKCPYCVRSSNIDDRVTCLINTEEGKKLSDKHQYFYQVQTQIHICKKEYCDFVVWTEKEVHIERIEPCEELWDTIVNKASDFHRMAVMPELVGKFFSRSSVLTESHVNEKEICDNSSGEELFCICQKPETNEMIACDNENCRLQWFHYHCMKMTASSIPKGKWYCHDCAKLPQFQKKKRAKRTPRTCDK